MNSPSDYIWIGEEVVLAIHEAQIAEHGGALGVRDAGLFASALVRPQQAAVYADAPDVAYLAALYALGIIKNHPFIDGNKRVGTVILETFLELHSYELAVTDAELLSMILAVAGGDTSDDDFTAWVRKNARRMEDVPDQLVAEAQEQNMGYGKE